jgi:hypothetical protein
MAAAAATTGWSFVLRAVITIGRVLPARGEGVGLESLECACVGLS